MARVEAEKAAVEGAKAERDGLRQANLPPSTVYEEDQNTNNAL